MERDIERLIQKKVMDAERQPIAWRKEQVWTNISTELQQKKTDHRIYYYAAACIALLIAAGFYLIMPLHRDQSAVSMDQPKTSVEITTPDSTVESTSAETPVVIPQKQHSFASREQKITTAPELLAPSTSASIDENLQPARDTLLSPPVAEVIQPQQKERIKPVIGVFDPTEP